MTSLDTRGELGPLTFGSKGVALPDTVYTAAKLFLICPPIVVNSPPTYRVDLSGESAKELTSPPTSGLTESTVPSARIWAIRFLVTPPTSVKLPPTYQPSLPS